MRIMEIGGMSVLLNGTVIIMLVKEERSNLI